MKKIDLIQGSEEWKAWRNTKITATDTSAILGINPFKTCLELYEEKMGIKEPKEISKAMARGSLLEEEARKLFIESMNINMTPAVVQSDEYYWAVCSLDGLSDCEDYILEIKCPLSIDTHELAIRTDVKPYYFSQMQKQLFCTRAKKCFYWSYHPDHETKTALVEIYPDHEYINAMLRTEKAFYEDHMLKMIPPPPKWKLTSKEPSP